MKKIPGSCPYCGKPLTIKRLECKSCGIALEGDFEFSKLSALNEEQLKMVERFVVSRGSIKEMERLMGISYPTVRNKLDEIIAALGYPVEKDTSLSKAEILSQLEKGEINADMAVELLNKRRD